MAIYGIGANYSGWDVFDSFIDNECARIGWSAEENISGHAMIKSMKAGDIVYIKKCNIGSPITVRAIGVIKDYESRTIDGVAEIARNVKWLYHEEFSIENPKYEDKNNVRSNSVYEEFNLNIIKEIIDKLPFQVYRRMQ